MRLQGDGDWHQEPGRRIEDGVTARSGVYRKADRFHLPSIMLLDHLAEVPPTARDD
jgi:hypothetical protein